VAGVSTGSKHFRFVALCVAVILIGQFFFIYDDVYGPKDEVIYLWPLLVWLIQMAALAAALFSSAFVIWRNVRA
jgi:hypothetical protein